MLRPGCQIRQLLPLSVLFLFDSDFQSVFGTDLALLDAAHGDEKYCRREKKQGGDGNEVGNFHSFSSL